MSLKRPIMGPRFRGDEYLFAVASACSSRTNPSTARSSAKQAQFALGVRHQQQHGFLPSFFQLVDALLDVGGVAHRPLCDLDDDLAA